MFKWKLLWIYMSIYVVKNFLSPVNCTENGVNSLTEYLNNRFEIMKDRITLLEHENIDGEDVYQLRLNFHTAKDFSLPLNLSYSTSVFQIFNKTFVLVDSEVYCMKSVSKKIILEFCDRLEHLKGEEILFAKATDFHDMGLLFVTLPTGFSHVYVYSKGEQQWIFLQTIRNKDTATGAIFFEQNAHLYLAITNNNLKGAPLTIYKWSGIHFDEESELFIGNCDGITSFTNNNGSEIIITTKIFSGKEFSTQVFEFKNDQLIKVQALDIPHPNHVIIYNINNDIYVAIYSSEGSFQVFRWTGSKLIPWFKMFTCTNLEKAIVTSFRRSPAVFLVEKEYLLIMQTYMHTWKLISKIKLRKSKRKKLDFGLLKYNDSNALVMFGLTHENTLSLSIIPFDITFFKQENYLEEKDPLLQCLANVQDVVNFQEVDAVNGSELFTNKSDSHIILGSNRGDTMSLLDFENSVKEILDKLSHLKSKLQDLFYVNSIVLEGRNVFEGNLNVDKITAPNLFISVLNNIRWTPDQWLLYSKPQIIQGKVIAKNIQADEIFVSNSHFNLLLKSGKQEIHGNFTFDTLTASRVYSQNINDILLKNIYLITSGSEVTGRKQFLEIRSTNLNAEFINGEKSENFIKSLHNSMLTEISSLPNMLTALYTKNINGVSFENLCNVTFQKGKSKRITGNLIFPRLSADHVTAVTLSGKKVEELFTTSTEQIVTSSLQLENVNANNLDVTFINNVDFSSEVATSENNRVKGFISIDNVKIENDLFITHDNKNQETKFKSRDHIIGTSESDLLQIYDSKVIIEGNLYVQSISLGNSGKILVGDENFTENAITKRYWSKSLNQEIPAHFEALQGISTTSLTTDTLNSITVDTFLRNNLDDKPVTNFVFKNLTIVGNINFTNPSIQVKHLRKIDKEIVRFFGQYVIKGKKVFSEKLHIGSLTTNFINNINADSLFEDNSEITGEENVFHRVVITGNLTTESAQVGTINGKKLDGIVLINQENFVTSLNFSHISVKNLEIIKHNSEDFTNYSTVIDQIYRTGTLKKLTGKNVFVSKINDLTKINNLSKKWLKDFLSMQSPLLANKVQFLGTVTTDNIQVSTINHVDFVKLTERLFYREWTQNISAEHSFRKLKTNHLWTDSINKIKIGNLVNIKSKEAQKLRAAEGLVLHSVNFEKSVYADGLQCDTKKIVESIRNPIVPAWKNVRVLGSTTLADENCLLGEILRRNTENAKNYAVYEQVTFDGNINANNIYVKGTINKISLSHLIQDALYINGDKQVVSSKTNFNYLFTSGATVVGIVKVPLINNIDVREMDKKIVRRSDLNKTIIEGRKTFYEGLQVDILSTYRLFDVEPKVFVNLNELKFVPNVRFNSVFVRNNLDIEFVNNLNVTYTLEQLLKKSSTQHQTAYGNYFFDDVVLLGDSEIEEINGVFLKDLLIDEGVQTLDTPIIFTDVDVHRKTNADRINKRNFNDIFENVLAQRNGVRFAENMEILAPSYAVSDINSPYINGYLVDDFKKLFEKSRSEMNFENVKLKLNRTQRVVQNTIRKMNVNVGKYLYIEGAINLQLSLPNVETAYATADNGYLMLHVTAKERGDVCGLPTDCPCSVQHTFQISPHLSVQPFHAGSTQRIFSYSDESITINVITNAVSTTERCSRQHLDHELTHVTWTRKNSLNVTTGSSYIYPEKIVGYVSGVKFFTQNNDLYFIISRYHIINEQNSLRCLVYKIPAGKEEILLVQEIESGGAPILDLFYSAQGVVLIICNTRNDTVYNNAGIYRFDESSDKFTLLRFIPGTGCSAVTAVVVDIDSLIVLQRNHFPLEVYKYSYFYDNYYFYQSFLLDSPVISVSAFYSGGFGISDAFLCIVTEKGHFYIYSFQHIQGWKLESKGELEGLQAFIPFEINNNIYIFAPSVTSSSLLKVMKHGIK